MRERMIGDGAEKWSPTADTTDRREDGLARPRDQLIFELSLLGERKSAKIIELLEELRHDSPRVLDRVDDDAAAMAKPTNFGAVRHAIEKVNRTFTGENG